jgi:hypothetical protein
MKKNKVVSLGDLQQKKINFGGVGLYLIGFMCGVIFVYQLVKNTITEMEIINKNTSILMENLEQQMNQFQKMLDDFEKRKDKVDNKRWTTI